MTQLLAGIRVVEAGGIGPTPFCAMLLADLGAEVIVIEQAAKAEGDVDLGAHSVINRGKKSIVLDFKDPADIETCLALCERADIVIEGFRPGVMERLGLGPEHCQARNPRLVYGRMTGWGQAGPRADTAGHDMNYTAVAGSLWYAGFPGTPPTAPASLIGDVGGALYLALGLVSAVLQGRQTGRGAVLDAAIVDANAHMLSLLLALRQRGMMQDERGASVLDGAHWSRTYRCSCGGHIAVQCFEQKFYRQFLDLLGLGADPQMRRQFDPASWPEQSARLAELFLTRSRDDWAELFAGTDACVAPVLSIAEAVNEPHMRAREIYVETAIGLQARPAPRVVGEPLAGLRPTPGRNEHRAEILALVGGDGR